VRQYDEDHEDGAYRRTSEDRQAKDRRVMDRLYVKEDRREFSDLAQTMLEDWLKGKR
jgi:hypothetical protein